MMNLKSLHRLTINRGGVTYSPTDDALVTRGYAVSVHKDRERKVAHLTVAKIAAYLWEHRDALLQPGAVFGAWFDRSSGWWYLDVSRVVADRAEALSLARQHAQLAVYSLHEGRTIEVETRESRSEYAANVTGFTFA